MIFLLLENFIVHLIIQENYSDQFILMLDVVHKYQEQQQDESLHPVHHSPKKSTFISLQMKQKSFWLPSSKRKVNYSPGLSLDTLDIYLYSYLRMCDIR